MSTSGIQAITEAEREEFKAFAQANPTVACELPVILPSGFLAESFSPVCCKCGKDVPEESSWLKRVRHEFGQNTVEIWDVRGHCKPCRAVTSCYMRFRSDGTYDTLIGHQWRYGSLKGPDKRKQSRTKAVIRKMLRWIFRL